MSSRAAGPSACALRFPRLKGYCGLAPQLPFARQVCFELHLAFVPQFALSALLAQVVAVHFFWSAWEAHPERSPAMAAAANTIGLVFIFIGTAYWRVDWRGQCLTGT